jgi:exosortase A
MGIYEKGQCIMFSIPNIWRTPLCLLTIATIILLSIGHEEVGAAISTWWSSTAYQHCFLVIPLSFYLATRPERKDRIKQAIPIPSPILTLLCLPIAITWFAADRLGIMEGRQFCLLGAFQILVLSVIGPQAWKRLSAPLVYLFFLVPSGAFLVPYLQTITVWFIMHGLNLFHISHFVDGNTIEIPEGKFFVAEACAGLRFLIAAVAFGVLYALTLYRSLGRRIAFIIASLVIPIIANGMRALGIVILGHILGSAEAGAADHLIYGWFFFSFVLLVMMLAGLPFRQDMSATESSSSPIFTLPSMRQSIITVLLALSLSMIGPIVSMALNARIGTSFQEYSLPLHGIDGCTSNQKDDAITCNGIIIDVHVRLFPSGMDSSTIFKSERDLTGELASEDAIIMQAQQFPWKLIVVQKPPSVQAVGLWIDGRPSGEGMTARLSQAYNSLFGIHCKVAVARLATQNYSNTSMALAITRQILEEQGSKLDTIIQNMACQGTKL